MIRLTAKREVRFSIIVIFFGISLLISTFFFPWISFQEAGNGEQEFHLNLEMMRDSTSPEIQNIANKLNVINIILWFTVIMGLLSLLSVSYHSATKNSHFGFYLMILSNIFIIAVAFLIGYLYYSVISYINNIETISLSSPFPYFTYSFFSLIGSIVFLIISALYGGFITILILKHFKELKKEEKKETIFPAYDEPSCNKNLEIEKLRKEGVSGLYSVTEKKDGLPTFSIKETDQYDEETFEEIQENRSEQFSFGEPDEISEVEFEEDKEEISNRKGKKIPKPFSFNKPKQKIPEAESKEKIPESFEEKKAEPFSFDKPKDKTLDKEEDKNIGLLKQNHTTDKATYNNDEIKKSEYLENKKDFEKENIFKPQKEVENSEGIQGLIQKNEQIHIIHDKKTYAVRCPQCKYIFSAEKSGAVTSVKCPMCSKEGIIK